MSSEILNNYIKTIHPDLSDYECKEIVNIIDEDIEKIISNYIEENRRIRSLAEELFGDEISKIDLINKFLKEQVSENTIQRLESINWKDLYKVSPQFDYRKHCNIYSCTCSGEDPRILRKEMINSAINNDSDNFIKCLNKILGNCCISNIYELDND